MRHLLCFGQFTHKCLFYDFDCKLAINIQKLQLHSYRIIGEWMVPSYFWILFPQNRLKRGVGLWSLLSANGFKYQCSPVCFSAPSPERVVDPWVPCFLEPPPHPDRGTTEALICSSCSPLWRHAPKPELFHHRTEVHYCRWSFKNKTQQHNHTSGTLDVIIFPDREAWRIWQLILKYFLGNLPPTLGNFF